LVPPEKLEIHFTRCVTEYEGAVKMPYVTSVERVSEKREGAGGEKKGQIGELV
jgi:hypothetical protein